MIIIILSWINQPRYSLDWMHVVRLEAMSPHAKEFRSYRLGNMLDAWYFGSLGSQERIKDFTVIRTYGGGDKSFCKYLKLNRGVTLKKNIKKLVDASESFWACYAYDNIQLALPNIRDDLRRVMQGYATEVRPSLRTIQFDRNTLVVHYRLGDFLALKQVISPESMLLAAKQFAIHFKYIVITGGGVEHVSNAKMYKHSVMLRDVLVASFRRSFPTAVVWLLDNDPDADFFALANAPYLLTAGGSFAIMGAIANKNGKIRTPASKNTNFPQRGMEAIRTVTANWKTYTYDML
jgi:hypothetical protein